MSEYLLKIGHKVVAMLRKPEVLSAPTARYSPTQLVFVRVTNNAGMCIVGEAHSLDETDARDILGVSFRGAVRVTKEVVLFFQ